ncbi:MAG: AAA family ATPase, partial [Planctomyces sp.]
MSPPLIKRVVLRNYRSIKSCSVDLSPLTVVVGRNAAGKSNFVDAIR